jgi:hypothetical protein
MSERVVADRVGFVGAAGPDSLRIPAEPSRLEQAAQQLGELADHLDKVGQHLAGTDGRHEDRKGHTTSALMSVAKWNGRTLSRDAVMLRELAEAAHREGQLAGDIQAHDLPQLRRRWAQAQEQFLTVTRQGTPAVADAHALMSHVDENLLRPYEDLFRELHGVHVSFGGPGHGEANAFLSDARTEAALSAYRQTVRSVLEEFAELAQRVQQADRAVEERAHRPEKDADGDESAAAVAFAAAGMVSGVGVLRHLVQDLREGARAADQGHDRLAIITSALQDGRLPVRAGQEREGFGAEWQRHFQRRNERLRTVCNKVDDVLEKFSRLDEECAAAIRAH